MRFELSKEVGSGEDKGWGGDGFSAEKALKPILCESLTSF